LSKFTRAEKSELLVLGKQLKMKDKSITRITIEEAKKQPDLTDWQRIEQMSEEEAKEKAQTDPDNLPLSYPPSDKLKRLPPRG
jgi:hypothetical protein